MYNIPKKHFYLYKMYCVQKLVHEVLDRKMKFCELIEVMISKIILFFSNKASFKLHENVNANVDDTQTLNSYLKGTYPKEVSL